MGLPGAIYTAGLIKAWIAIGLTVGAWVNWKFVAPRLRAYTETARNSITIPSFFGRRLRDRTNLLRIVAALVIGVGLVIGCNTFPTWNAYPGIFASLATGNPVVVKPHPQAVLPLAITVEVAREVLAELIDATTARST